MHDRRFWCIAQASYQQMYASKSAFGMWHKTVAASVETVALHEKQEVLMLCPCPVTINQ